MRKAHSSIAASWAWESIGVLALTDGMADEAIAVVCVGCDQEWNMQMSDAIDRQWREFRCCLVVKLKRVRVGFLGNISGQCHISSLSLHNGSNSVIRH